MQNDFIGTHMKTLLKYLLCSTVEAAKSVIKILNKKLITIKNDNNNKTILSYIQKLAKSDF